MTPLKDALEVSTPASETTTTHASERAKAESGHLRSDAVSLDVPVKVHGSRVTEAVRGVAPNTEPIEEQASTMIVFPQGGVLRMSAAVNAGQMLVLTNLKSGHDAICRVVKVRAYAQTQSYVELEFTNRQPGYWGVHFASDELEPVRTVLPQPPPPPVSVAHEPAMEKAEAKSTPNISWAPAASLQAPPAKPPETAISSSPVKSPNTPSQRVAQPSKQESSFVGIGSQEEVQPAASATTSKKKAERFVAPASSLSMAELRGDMHAAAPASSTSLGAGVPGEMTDLSEALAESSQEKQPATFGRLAASASLSGGHTEPQKAFGARFDSTALGVSEQAAELHKNSGPNWFLIAAGIAALVVAGAGGGFYFHVWPVAKSGPRSESVPTPAISIASPATASPAESNLSQIAASSPVAQTNQPSLAGAASGPGVSIRIGEAAPERANKPPAAERIAPSAPVSQKAPNRVPDMSARLNAHPVSSQRSVSGDAEPAPSVDAGAASPGSELQGIAVSSEVAPPPPPAEAAAPVKVGGELKPPKIISSVMPVYPSMAKATGIQGAVVVEASVDQSGNVVATKVISGPPVLRQAAVDALRRWKYQPAMLNGEPVAVQITVTMQFHNLAP
ncbi:MAG: TonB family protein [Candidatus Acidoferrales bacterium]|nr:TonB family protein [Candidatus Acidoferrales bacterium]